MKRFYKTVECKLENGEYYFYLDDKIIKTPAGKNLSTPSLPKAKAVLIEWNNQLGNIVPHTMPVTKYLNSVHDKIIPHYDYIINQLLDYVDSDCVFFFCDKINSGLYKKQQECWLPVINYFEKKYNVNLNYGTQLNLDNQPNDFKNHLQAFFKSLSFEDLTGIYTIITHLSSVLLGIYAYHRQIDYDVALEYSRLEEHDNIKNWGLDLDVEKKHSLIAKDYKQAVAFLQDTLV